MVKSPLPGAKSPGPELNPASRAPYSLREEGLAFTDGLASGELGEATRPLVTLSLLCYNLATQNRNGCPRSSNWMNDRR